MSRWTYLSLFVVLLSALAGCVPAAPVATPVEVDDPLSKPEQSNLAEVAKEYPVIKKAPELHDGVWINSDPLKLADLRGQVVLLEMWTFACYNCQNVMPHLKEWYANYADDGFVIIGNHYPEFSFEADLDNLKAAIAKEGIEYPVIQDNHKETWRAYNNHYWPTLYLIDKQGNIRYTHVGEGHYAETEAVIQALLAEEWQQ